jgi:hypothetical protein
MVTEPVDDKNLALVGLLHLLGGVVLALGALVTSGDDRSVFGALAFFTIMSGAVLEYIGHRGQVRRAMRRRAANRRNHA